MTPWPPARLRPGQVNAVAMSGTQSVAVTFTTEDGNTASGTERDLTNLTTLPPGWSSSCEQYLACNSVSTGNGCQLQLTLCCRPH